MKRLLVTMVSGMVLLLGSAAPAGAATTGAQTFTIYFGDGGEGTVVARGPIQGAGTETEIANDGQGTGTDIAAFRNGTVEILHVDTGYTDSFNERACVARFSGTGNYTLVGGTGAYAGASGSGTYTYRGTFIGERTADGCSEDGSVFTTVRATGTTTLP